jgi:hypothetical protein
MKQRMYLDIQATPSVAVFRIVDQFKVERYQMNGMYFLP